VSQGTSCKCPESLKPVAERNWGVSQRNQNASAFNGYRAQWSEYSAVRCLSCKSTWRTRAKMVDQLPNISMQDGDFQFTTPQPERTTKS